MKDKCSCGTPITISRKGPRKKFCKICLLNRKRVRSIRSGDFDKHLDSFIDHIDKEEEIREEMGKYL